MLGVFSVNQLDGEKFPIPEQGTGVIFNESRIRVTNIEIQTDAAGNRIIYSSYRPDEILKHCYFFWKKRFSWRKWLTKNFLHPTKFIMKQEWKRSATFWKISCRWWEKYNGLSAAEKQSQNYWPEIIRKNKEAVEKHKTELQKITSWYNEAMQQPNSNAIAYVTSVNESHFILKD